MHQLRSRPWPRRERRSFESCSNPSNLAASSSLACFNTLSSSCQTAFETLVGFNSTLRTATFRVIATGSNESRIRITIFMLDRQRRGGQVGEDRGLLDSKSTTEKNFHRKIYAHLSVALINNGKGILAFAVTVRLS